MGRTKTGPHELPDTRRSIASGSSGIRDGRNLEPSSHTRFVLKYLLGYPDVRNWDGSWTEWGSSVQKPPEDP